MPGLVMKYFVLKPAGDDVYAKASRMAMRKYAEAVAQANPELTHQIRDWVDQEHAEAYARSLERIPQDTVTPND
jgi:hypothetical protein